AYLGSEVPAGSRVVLRYHLPTLNCLSPNDYRWCFKVRYRDTGYGSQVVVRLVEYDLETGESTTRASFDSDSQGYESSYGFLTRYICFPPWYWNCYHKCYYLECELVKRNCCDIPGIGVIQ